MRALFLTVVAATLVAGCSKNEAGGNDAQAQAPAPKPTGPPPLTPKLDVQPMPGNSDHWMAPTSNAGDPASAPYGNLLDQPVVDAKAKPR